MFAPSVCVLSSVPPVPQAQLEAVIDTADKYNMSGVIQRCQSILSNTHRQYSLDVSEPNFVLR